MFKLPYSCTHFTCQQDYAQNHSSQASAVPESRISVVEAGFRKGRGTRADPISAGSQKKQEELKKSTSASLTTLKPLTVWITINCGKFLNRWGYPRSLYARQEATVRTGYGTMD